MVVGYLDIVRSICYPVKAHTILIVDSDTVLPFPVRLKSFEPIRGRDSQVFKGNGGLTLIQLPQRRLGNVCPLPVPARSEQLEGVRVLETDDHTYIV